VIDVDKLVDEDWQGDAMAAVDKYQQTEPDGWRAYIAEADEASEADAPITDDWVVDGN
jgi:hypothetical protein